MATNFHIDGKLLTKALRISGKKSKRETVNEALEEYVRYREQMKIAELFGTIDYAKDHDHKTQRRRNVGTRRTRGKR